MTAMFNFVPDLRECITVSYATALTQRIHHRLIELAPVVSIAEKPPLQIPDVELDEVDWPIPVKSGPEQRNNMPPVCPLL